MGIINLFLEFVLPSKNVRNVFLQEKKLGYMSVDIFIHDKLAITLSIHNKMVLLSRYLE